MKSFMDIFRINRVNDEMEPMGTQQPDLALPTKTTATDVASKQLQQIIASHASPTSNEAGMSSSPSSSSGSSPASAGGSSHHSPAAIGGSSHLSPSTFGKSTTGGSSHHSPAAIGGSRRQSPSTSGSLGTCTTGGARRDKLLDNPQMHGKSKKYSSIGRLKLASQVGVDSSGGIRKDFPFEKMSSRSKLKELTHNTLFSTVPPKKRKVDDWVAEQTSSESLTTSGDVSFVFGKTHHHSYSYVAETEKSEDVSTTELENSSLIVNVSSTAGDLSTISNTPCDVMTNPDDRDDESMVGDGAQVTTAADGSDHTYASHGDATRDYLGDADNEASAEANNVTSESTIGSGELFSVDTVPETPEELNTVPETPEELNTVPETPEELNTSATLEVDVIGDDTLTQETTKKTSKGKKRKTHALVVGGGDGERHVTITVHSDVTGLVSDISKKWRSYTQSLKNMSLKTYPVVSMTNLNPTAGRSGRTKTYQMTSSVTGRDSPKKIKIYVDEDLEVEAGLIQERIEEKREDPTKGPDIGIRVKYCTTITETETAFNPEKVQQFMFHLGRKRIVLSPDGLEIFEGVRRQVNLPRQYTASQLKSDMLTYLNKNSDYFTVLLETNLNLRDLNFDQFVKKVSNSTFHGYDLTMMILSKMLKVVILFQHPDYLWMSTPDVNVLEASVVLVYDGTLAINGTEYVQRRDRPLPFRNRYYFSTFVYPTIPENHKETVAHGQPSLESSLEMVKTPGDETDNSNTMKQPESEPKTTKDTSKKDTKEPDPSSSQDFIIHKKKTKIGTSSTRKTSARATRKRKMLTRAAAAAGQRKIQQQRKTYPLRSGSTVPPAITAPTKLSTNNEKENVKPKSTRVKVPTKTVLKSKPITQVDLTATTEEDKVIKGNSDSIKTGVIETVVTNGKRRTRKPTVVVSASVVTEPLVPQVPVLNYETPAESVKSRKRKLGAVTLQASKVGADSLQASEVMQSRKRPKGVIDSPLVSDKKTGPVGLMLVTPTQPDKTSKRKQKVGVPPAQEVVNSDAIVVASKNRKRKFAEPILVKNEPVKSPLIVSGQKRVKATLVPSTIIPSSSKHIVTNESDGDSQSGEIESVSCSKCNKVFEEVDELELHEKKCFVGRRYPCKYPGCGHVNSQNSLLNEHVKGVHENNPFKCNVCSETFIYWKSLRKHEKRSHVAKPDSKHMFKYNCTECDFVSDDKTEFQTHIDRHMQLKRYKCNVCAMAFFTQSQLTKHLKKSCTTLIGYKYECSVCGKRLKSEDRYREHFYSQHVLNQPQKMYYCEICISRFFSERGLQIHGCVDSKK